MENVKLLPFIFFLFEYSFFIVVFSLWLFLSNKCDFTPPLIVISWIRMKNRHFYQFNQLLSQLSNANITNIHHIL